MVLLRQCTWQAFSQHGKPRQALFSTPPTCASASSSPMASPSSRSRGISISKACVAAGACNIVCGGRLRDRGRAGGQARGSGQGVGTAGSEHAQRIEAQQALQGWGESSPNLGWSPSRTMPSSTCSHCRAGARVTGPGKASIGRAGGDRVRMSSVRLVEPRPVTGHMAWHGACSTPHTSSGAPVPSISNTVNTWANTPAGVAQAGRYTGG